MGRYTKWKKRFRTLNLEWQALNLDFQQLKKTTKTLQANLQHDDLELNQTRKKTARSAHEVESLQTLLLETKQTNVVLEKQIQELSGERQILRENVRSLEIELQRNLNCSDEFSREIKYLEGQKIALQTENTHKTAEISRQIQNCETLRKELGRAKFRVSGLSELKKENQKLREGMKVLAKEVERLNTIDGEVQTLKNVLWHVKTEFLGICQFVGAESCEIQHPWASLHQRCEELISAVCCVNEIKERNDGLIRKLRSSQKSSQNVESFGNILGLAQDLREKNAQKDHRITQLYSVHEFAARIVELYFKFVNRLNELHQTIFPIARCSMKVTLLAVLFSQRLSKVVGHPFSTNVGWLSVFGAPLVIAPDLQFTDIEQKIQGLSNELVSLKEVNLDLRVRLSDLECAQEMKGSEIPSKNHMDEERVKVLTRRVRELQSELCGLVSPDMYAMVCDRVVTLESQIKDLEKEIERLRKELDGRQSIELDLKNQIEETGLAVNQEAENTDMIRRELSKREERIENMEVMLKSMDREVLSLERQSRHRPLSEINPKTSLHPRKVCSVVNPAFLAVSALKPHIT
jgi:DNA repair exonuclease SbcCD ATPase subunit